ncbi:MAG: DNA polymerase IV [Nitrospirae bacterium]|nr:DNA polymerase IV [Nitrospirota bacterium]
MDSFFSAVEERRRPELKGKPVVVGGSGDPFARGVVSTANYEARKYGIHSGMPLRTAYRLCPHAVFLSVDIEVYAEASSIVKRILREFGPTVEDVGIDEAFLDISESKEPSEEIARRIKEKILKETSLTCSIGIGINKLIAKIASDIQKPDGLTIVEPSKINEFLNPLPVRKLYGVGPKTEAYLNGLGIDTIGHLSAMSLEELTKHFGNSYGTYLHEASRGIDESPLITEWEPRSMSRELTFQKDSDKWQTIAKTLAELTHDVTEDLKSAGYQAKTVTVKIRYSDFKTQTRAKSLDTATDSLESLRKTAFEALGRFELKGKKIRLVGVRLSGLQ